MRKPEIVWERTCSHTVSVVSWILCTDGAYTLNSIKQMKMLTMCLKEATRLYPPAGGIARDLEEPTVINGVEVDKGMAEQTTHLGSSSKNSVLHYDMDSFSQFQQQHGIYAASCSTI